MHHSMARKPSAPDQPTVSFFEYNPNGAPGFALNSLTFTMADPASARSQPPSNDHPMEELDSPRERSPADLDQPYDSSPSEKMLVEEPKDDDLLPPRLMITQMVRPGYC
jgi:hypothetical protein